MSFPAIRFALDFPKLNASERLTLLLLADRASKSGHCFPSQAYLADRSGLGLRTVTRSLKGLEEKGAIKRTKRSSKAGRTSDDYLILMPRQHAKLAGTQHAKSADRFTPNSMTIPTCPNGLGKEEEETLASRKLTLIVGGRC